MAPHPPPPPPPPPFQIPPPLCPLLLSFLPDLSSPSPDTPTTIFGTKLREQVEERLAFFDSGTMPRKNEAVMKEAIKELNDTKMDIGTVDETNVG